MNVLGRGLSADFRWPWQLPAWDADDYGTYIDMRPDPLRLAWWRVRVTSAENTRTGAIGYAVQLLGLRLYFFPKQQVRA